MSAVMSSARTVPVIRRLTLSAFAQSDCRPPLDEPLIISPSEVQAVADFILKGLSVSETDTLRRSVERGLVAGECEFLGRKVRVL